VQLHTSTKTSSELSQYKVSHRNSLEVQSQTATTNYHIVGNVQSQTTASYYLYTIGQRKTSKMSQQLQTTI